MERAVAIRKLTKLLGKSVAWRVDPDGLDAEARERARGEASVLAVQYRAAEDARKARLEMLLAADEEYQRHASEAARLRKERDKAVGASYRHRFTVGTNNSLFFHVKAQGDSWEDVIAQLEKKR